ncbi:hypothetical protein Afil01_32230 [Actinorhabdospora filicis]|uniref:Uncharacterized protein n=1 Tax=Actinorhabdospora filicis TaxID=1785913 RepID=A0A9W6SPL6_9ACTN|nr:hypothetical protein [Actinorhabdospora filicis]GLZ78416.1 hypothetical protein Afil01_32230 [Actinorhabdospora filicis]
MLTRDQIDDLLLHEQIPHALKAIMERDGCSLKDAIVVVDKRVRELRDARPGDFTVSEEDYGRDIYT